MATVGRYPQMQVEKHRTFLHRDEMKKLLEVELNSEKGKCTTFNRSLSDKHRLCNLALNLLIPLQVL